MRKGLSLIALLASAWLLPAGGAAAQSPYAPLDRDGPPLSVPEGALRAALKCSPNVSGATRNPILLVPGTNLDPEPNFSWNYERAIKGFGWPYCTITLPHHTMGDVQVAGEYIVDALRTMSRQAGRRVDVLGFSQGGMVPRWALRFWPDTRRMVGDLVGLAPSNHGTENAHVTCTRLGCPPAYWQQATRALFIGALNSRTETFAGIDYTVAFTRNDEVVTPNFDTSGSSSLRSGGGRISNVLVQSICPNDTSEHLALGSYDPVGYALAIDALTHDGPANPARVASATCSQPFHPGVNAATFGSDYAAYLASVGRAFGESPQVASEPPLKCYVFAACPASARGGTRGSLPCLARRSPIGSRNIGRIRIGATRRALLRLPVRSPRRTRHGLVWCVKGGRGRVVALLSRRGRVAMVATTAPGHGNRRVRPTRRSALVRRAYPRRRRVARGVFRAAPRSTRLIGVRRGRVRIFAVASRGLLRDRAALRRYLRRAAL